MAKIKINMVEYTTDIEACIKKHCPKDEQVTKWTIMSESVLMHTEPKTKVVVQKLKEVSEVNNKPVSDEKPEAETDKWFDFLDRSVKDVINAIENGEHTQEQLKEMFSAEMDARDRVTVKKAITGAM